MAILKTSAHQHLFFTLLIGSVISLSAQTPPAREYQIKAGFLFNFTQFIEWPASAFVSTETPIVIGVLGEDPFNAYLDEIVSGETVNGHPLVVQRFKTISEVNTCHILFINITETAKLEEIVTSLKGRNILTVSDAANFMQQGGMIRFVTVNKKIQFQINPEATKEADLSISSKVLRLAEIVVPKKK
ncbi:MAG: YfiR family protein [Bacteroidota bacterium]